MSPTTKKYLMYGGAAVAVFVIYKMVKKPAAAPTITGGALTPDRRALIIAPENVTKLSDVVEDLGLEQDLGSLGRSSIGRRYQ